MAYEPLFSAGHTACAGCPMPTVIRQVLEATGPDVVVVNATSCSEIISSAYPRSAWRVPYVHSLFENPPAVASGVVRALRAQGNGHTTVLVVAGDGSTYDIGFGALSGMLERNEDVLYVCYDNEAYMNTGVQRSGATPYGARTTTSPVGRVHRGKELSKKPIVEIVAAHRVPYAASASIGHPQDLAAKVKKAMGIRGSRFIDVFSPCIPGWGIPSDSAIRYAKLAVETGLWRLSEYEHGEFKLNVKPSPRKPVKEYFAGQARFRHLKDEDVAKIQAMTDEEWKKLG
ncbi:MAG: thiamine pyrophosphate-dependent enzyme [Candidatus ainarchaeum sp.]|nr:thiamine pyrophosphate-dependent enzyme [Candidatus ainarchaeum sp.]